MADKDSNPTDAETGFVLFAEVLAKWTGRCFAQIKWREAIALFRLYRLRRLRGES